MFRAQLRFTDLGGHRLTCFATDSKGGQLGGLELRHRLRARREDRIRAAKDTGLRNPPRHGYTQNQIWAQLVAIARELRARTQMLAFTGQAHRWEPNACGCGSSLLPGAPPEAAGACGSASPHAGPAPL